MKKIISILLAVLVIGCFGVEAKTTKKSGKMSSKSHQTHSSRKSQPSLSIKLFIDYDLDECRFKDLNDIYEAINDIGFSYLDHEDNGSNVTVTFYKNEMKIEITYNDEDVEEVKINFGSATEKNNFKKTIDSSKYKNLEIEESGNTITLYS